jgi:uncharacterized protein YndB with AHSA1/START domain
MKTESNFKPLHLNYLFQASLPTVFDAWITKPVAELWLFKNQTNQLNYETTAEEGGSFSIDEQDGEIKIGHWGQWLEIDRPKRLRFTLEVPKHFAGVSEVTIELQETMAGTELNFVQKNIDVSKTKSAWENMFVALDDVLKQPYLVTVESGIDQVIPAIMVVAMQVVGLARSLDQDEWNTVPYPGSWTPAQLVRHLVKSVSGIGPLIGQPTNLADRDPREKILPLKQNFLDITKRMQSPEFIVPEKMRYNKQSLIEQFEAALAPLTRIRNVNGNELITGLPLGPTTKRELIHFILYHLQRHLIQMKRITEAVLLKRTNPKQEVLERIGSHE